MSATLVPIIALAIYGPAARKEGVIVATAKTFKQEVLEHDGPVAVQLVAPWCGKKSSAYLCGEGAVVQFRAAHQARPAGRDGAGRRVSRPRAGPGHHPLHKASRWSEPMRR